jgi:hypothetical protein
VPTDCRCIKLGKKGPFKTTLTTFPSGTKKVLNCGNCGLCSNCQDIEIYATRTELWDLPCAVTYLTTKLELLASGVALDEAVATGKQQADECLEASVGLTDDCRSCWTDAVVCNPEKCVTVDFDASGGPIFGGACGPLAALALNGDPFPTEDPEFQQAFLQCLVCDTQKCEPEFLECAGANRRRIGRVAPDLAALADLLGQPICEEAALDDVCNLSP